MKKIKWLFVSNYGRYVLGIILALTGVFSQYGTIDFLRTDWRLFEYTTYIGCILLGCQFLFHMGAAITSRFKR